RAAVDQVSEQIGQASSAIEQMTGRARQVNDALQQMTNIVEQSASGAANVSAATQEQMASVEEIASSSTSLGQMADEMRAMCVSEEKDAFFEKEGLSNDVWESTFGIKWFASLPIA
ncbi:hypothetical protein P9711_15745, partial [Anoxybacillus geothermalis]|nr:hypothetical protein [Anoxybacillus geothermalis]